VPHNSIIDANFVAKAGLRALRAKKILRATIPGNTTITLNRVVTVPVTIGNMHSTNTFYVMTGMLRGVDAIIGMDWMVRHDAWVGTREALLHVTTPSGKNLVLKGVSNADEGFTVGAFRALAANPKYISAKTGKEGDAQRLRSHTMHGESTTGDDRDTVDPIEKEIEKVTTSFGVEFDATLKQLLLSTKAVFKH
jgi:hypothetical protein